MTDEPCGELRRFIESDDTSCKLPRGHDGAHVDTDYGSRWHTGTARAVRSSDAINALRDDPEVIVIRRRATTADGIPGDWTIFTARHNTIHHTIDLDALLMVKVLMTQQEKDLP